MEIIEAILMHGKVDLASTLRMQQSCRYVSTLLTARVMDTICENDDTHLWMFLADATLTPRSIPYVKGLIERVKEHNQDTMTRVTEALMRSDIIHDVKRQEQIIQTCFDFRPTDDCPFHIIRTMVDIISSRPPGFPRGAVFMCVLLFKVVSHMIVACIETKTRPWKFMCNTRFVQTMVGKLEEILTDAPQYLPDRSERKAITTEIHRILRISRAWRHAINTGDDIDFGARNGIYTVSSTGRKRYW
jgi:hypothetical protein